MKNCLYISLESNNFEKETGAYEHTIQGIKNLGLKYKIITYPPFPNAILSDKEINKKPINKSGKKRIPPFLKNILKDCLIIFTQIKHLIIICRILKKNKIDFVYERSSSFGVSALLVCKLSKTPLFYEINGINYQDYKTYRFSIINFLLGKIVENMMYSFSDLNFAVGGIKYLLPNSIQKKTIQVQNGIDNIKKYKTLKKSNKIKIAFIAHVMPHHNLNWFLRFLQKNEMQLQAFEFIFFGKNYNKEQLKTIENIMNCKYKGILERDEELYGIHCGIIPYAREYDSHMKVFQYANNSLSLILPKTKNFLDIFSEREVFYFDTLNNESLLSVLQKIDFDTIIKKSQLTYSTISKNYTWEYIFKYIISSIENIISTEKI